MWLWRAGRRTAKRKRVLAIVLTGACAAGLAAEPTDLPPLDVPRLPAVWDSLFTVRTDGGYRDNVTLAYKDPASSAFVAANLEALVNRVSLDGSQLSFFLDGYHRQYLSGPVDEEESVSAMAEYKLPWGRRWEASLAAQCLYLDQVMDVSFTETNREAVRVRGPSITARPGLRVDLGGGYYASLEGLATRRLLDEPLDDQWEGSTRLRLGREYGPRNEVHLGYEPLYRAYDDATEVNAQGVSVPGTHRAYWQHDLRLTWRHYWDAHRRWRTAARLGAKVNDDNGSGYFNYTRPYGGLEVRYRTPKWEVSLEANAGHYLYSVQTVSPTDLRKRDSLVVDVSLRFERALSQKFRLVAAYDYEQVFSNDRLETYTVNTVSGGLSYEF